jgi:predicted helicase
MNVSYIYIRTNEYWDLYDVFKLGKTANIPDREQTYITGEIKRGNYVMIIEMETAILDKVERQLQRHFNELKLHVKFDAGVEFYKKKIVDFIIPYFDANNIVYKILSKNEMNELVHKIRMYNDVIEDTATETTTENATETATETTTETTTENATENTTETTTENATETTPNTTETTNKSYIPRNYQETIIHKSNDYFQSNDKGLLILPCGVGKSLISLWIAQKMNAKTILIGVPNILLLKQWKKDVCELFPYVPHLIISGGVEIEHIIRFLENNHQTCIIITTYSSSYKIFTATQNVSFIFDIKINDECHHLTSNNINEMERKTYINMLKINSNKQISLTATIKLLENKENVTEVETSISNDNTEYFGEIIDKKCLLWAINENIICDYVIQTIIANEEQLEQHLLAFHIVEENDKRLFLSAFASLKSICDGNSHNLLIYSNNTDNSLKIIQYIKMLLDDKYFVIPDLYYSNYHSEIKPTEQKEIIRNFKEATYGIIACVYCLCEGWDFPPLDAVVFAENMTSNIRIVQSALRASRKNTLQPDKITKIILPILNRDDWLENGDNQDLKKVREVIYQMGLEDETVSQKIKVFLVNVEKQKAKALNGKKDEKNKTTDDFGEYNDELTQKLRLKTTKRTALSITYEKARKIIAPKNIKSKEEYFELCKMDIRLSHEPEVTYGGQFTNWIDYLGIERIYYDMETCKNKVGEYLILFPELKIHYLNLSVVVIELCKLDTLFPPNGLWVEYYDVKDMRDLIAIKNNKKRTGIVS